MLKIVDDQVEALDPVVEVTEMSKASLPILDQNHQARGFQF